MDKQQRLMLQLVLDEIFMDPLVRTTKEIILKKMMVILPSIRQN